MKHKPSSAVPALCRSRGYPRFSQGPQRRFSPISAVRVSSGSIFMRIGSTDSNQAFTGLARPLASWS